MPAWFALIVQVPAPVIETVAPEIVQMPALVASAENATTKPELADALTVYVDPPMVAPAGALDVKLIDCVLADGVEIPNDCCTCVAAW